LWLVLADFGGPSGLGEALVASFGPSVVSWRPPLSHELLGVLAVVAWTVGTAVGYGGDAAPMSGAMEGQRILSSRDGREAAKMYVWTQVILFFMLLAITLPALGAMVRWPGLRDGTINRELAYGMLLAAYLPAGLLGLAVSGILASIMSTVSSNMNFGAQVFLNDVYRRSIAPNASNRHYLVVGRLVATAIVLLAMIVASTAENVIDIAVFMLGLSSAELTANWAQWWWWRFNGPARLAASFGGPLIFLFNQYVLFRAVIDVGDAAPYVVVLASMAGTCVLWIIVALSTAPEPDDTLVEFYRRARPMGAWGPIANKAGLPVAGWTPVFHGLGIATLGAVMIGGSIIALSLAFVARWGQAGVAVAFSVVAGMLFRRLFIPFVREFDGPAGERGASPEGHDASPWR
jgi:Na+/proline symporter